MIPHEVSSWIKSNGFGEVVRFRSMTGGCINNGAVLTASSGPTFFLKTNTAAPPDMFEREVEGLAALLQPGTPRVPETLLFGPAFLLMEDLRPASPADDYWEVFGRQLALLHLHVTDRFGFHHNNYIGSTPQVNSWSDDGYVFFAEQRLGFQARLALDSKRLDRPSAARVERVANRLREWIPAQPASILHGDLWSGNAISDDSGRPALIDPAAYFGWAEADLAMSSLFGRFPPVFYAAYQDVRLLKPGFEDRYPIYNLYHLLNHLNLFGGGYLGQVHQVLDRLGV